MDVLSFIFLVLISFVFMFMGGAWIKSEISKPEKYNFKADLKDTFSIRWRYGSWRYTDGIVHLIQPVLLFSAGPFIIVIFMFKKLF